MKSEVKSINYANGEIDYFSTDTQINEILGIVTTEPHEDNLFRIREFNAELPQRENKSSNTITNYAYIYYGIKESSILCSSDIEISIERNKNEKDMELNLESQTDYSFSSIYYFIKVKNKTNSPLYIDLGNTYRVNSIDGESSGYAWYDGSFYSESIGDSKSSALSLGAITNAIGMQPGELLSVTDSELNLETALED